MLECLSRDPISVKDISVQTGIPVSTVHRLLRPLLARRYAFKHGWGTYGAGLALKELSSRIDVNEIIARVSRPFVVELARACNRTAHLGVLHGNMIRYLVKVDRGGLMLPSREATDLEAYCTGLGKAVLSQLGPDELDDYLANGDFVALTENTIVQRERLENELAGVRDCGWTLDRGEFLSNLYCLAAPITVQENKVLAAISISEIRNGAAADADPSEFLQFLPLVQRAATEISRLVGINLDDRVTGGPRARGRRLETHIRRTQTAIPALCIAAPGGREADTPLI